MTNPSPALHFLWEKSLNREKEEVLQNTQKVILLICQEPADETLNGITTKELKGILVTTLEDSFDVTFNCSHLSKACCLFRKETDTNEV